MNYANVGRMLGWVLVISAGLLLLPLAVAIVYHEARTALSFVAVILISGLLGFLLTRLKSRRSEIYARDGFMIVGLSWVLLSALGALPFVLSGDIPNYIDAVFETVSGFTTTGATILTDIEGMSRGCMFWRCFTHWIGGMGILVFVMAVLPMSGSNSMHIMRAEVPGPTVGKLVPRARKTASILYLIYIGLTAAETILLLLGGMNLYDALCHAFATAGTGGFSTRAASVGAFNSPYIEWVVGVFMLLFGVNFNLYYLVLIGRWKNAVKSEELRCYLGIIAFSVVSITIGIARSVGGVATGVRQAFFQVCSIISTTGFSTANFDLWPEYVRWLLVLLMFIGACAGSTGGGIKVSRIMILVRSSLCDLRQLHRPREINRVRLEGRVVDDETVRSTRVFFVLYIMLTFLAVFVVSFDGFDLQTSFTGVVACISNIGPGLSLVGPEGGFAMFSWLPKLVLIWCMLLGRLELYPMLLIFAPSMWKRH